MSTAMVWAVITAYRPDAGLAEAVEALRDQVTAIVVVDDGSGDESSPLLARIQERGAIVVRNAENRGIAFSLNVGIMHALDGGADAVLTLDQDSAIGSDFVQRLGDAREAAMSAGHADPPIVPEYFAGVRQVRTRTADGTLVARHAIQSGMLLSRTLLEQVGMMREDLFIDLVDTEFEMRCVSAGKVMVAAPGLRLGHSLGRQYVRTLFGRPFSFPGIPAVITLSTPFRYYYRVRNRVVINREFGRTHFLWTARDTLLEAVHFLNAWQLAQPRRSLFSVYRAAVRDARARRMGRMDARTAALASSIKWRAEPLD
ncbi:glycosyltransferase [Microbacterium sp.]|uniref:glycosyltransferase n=1 Tax=Microbacterium sp. TaxID=51671 RepID=UPI002811FA3A|nr:glycosyltransferase [Microbacterium sp.]